MGAFSKNKGKLYELRLYHIWANMKYRCSGKDKTHHKEYSDRGIKVCAEWQEFMPFYKWAIKNGYRDDLTIDRIDFNGDYEPSNCRWADLKTQNNNTRWNKFLEYNGERLTVSQWAEKLKLSRTAVYKRLSEYGWSVEKTLTTPIRKKAKYIG